MQFGTFLGSSCMHALGRWSFNLASGTIGPPAASFRGLLVPKGHREGGASRLVR